jgi:NO-binding membrane sensor protein with MHYT domain
MAGVLATQVQHFTYGPITPILAYALSVLGSLLGLTCTARARRLLPGNKRAGWLMMAAWAIGGTGIWTMHFMAMLGFGVPGSTVTYDIGRTALSAVIAVGVVGIGVFIAGLGKASAPRVLIGGLFTGVGVASMHYTGMAAVELDGTIHYNRNLVIASVVIAVVAATVALWFTLVIVKPAAIFGAALVMGVAVCGMHYTAMAAVSVAAGDHAGRHGAMIGTLLIPIIFSVLVVVVMLFYALLSEPKDDDAATRAYLERQAAKQWPAAPQGSAMFSARGRGRGSAG